MVPLLLLALLAAVAVAVALAIALARARAQLAGSEERVRLTQASREQLREEMKAITSDVLSTTSRTLAEQVAAQRRADEQRAAGELAKRTEEIKRVVEPIGEKLTRVESKVVELDRERRRAEGQLGETVRALREGVAQLASEANNLSSALKRPSTRGAWGEIQLRNVIEMAGMVERCDFVAQATIDTGDGRLRPDVLINLPGGKLVVVDSKVPLDAYLAQIEAKTDEERELHAARHARQTRDHIAKLASKGYQSQFDTTPELVVMFVPSEGIYHAALAADPSLLEYGVDQQVLLATPTTLIGLLRAIYYGWKQELIAESAREIADTGRELHRRLAIFAEPLAKLGRQLGSAIGAYNDAVGSFDRRVAPQLRKIEAAGAGSDRKVPPLAPVEQGPRVLTAVLEPGEAAAQLESAEPAGADQVEVIELAPRAADPDAA
jgi:DNA recombination protein RmuC